MFCEKAALKYKRAYVLQENLDLQLLIKVEKLLLVKLGFGLRSYTAHELILFILSSLFGSTDDDSVFEHNEKVRTLLEYSKSIESIIFNHTQMEMVFAAVYLFIESSNQEGKVECLRDIAKQCLVDFEDVLRCAKAIETDDEELNNQQSICKTEEALAGNYLSTSVGRESAKIHRNDEDICLSVRSEHKITEESIDFFLLDQTSKLEISRKSNIRTHTFYKLSKKSGNWSRMRNNKSLA